MKTQHKSHMVPNPEKLLHEVSEFSHSKHKNKTWQH
jgi:hypothetical protein